jgi:hypothetical protein
MTTVRFDLVRSSNRDEDCEVARVKRPQVPSPGQTVSLPDGNPYVVLDDIGWAARSPRSGGSYAYVRVAKLYNWPGYELT